MREKATIMILPVGLDCNMACSYCYHTGKDYLRRGSPRMSDKILRKIIVGASRLAKNVDFLWHGGEPLLIGVNHFKKAVQIEREIHFSGEVRNMVQTNGTLLTKSLCDFFTKESFEISTSLDGSKKINDANRRLVNGKGTYDRVEKAINLWRAMGNNIGAVVLVTKTNINRPLETYNGIRNSGVTSCVLHFCSQNEKGSVDVIPEENETFKFFRSVFDVWFKDDNPNFPIRNFRNIIRTLCGGKTLDCASTIGGCYGFIAVSGNGNVYSCHRFVGRDEFLIGNICEKDLDEIYESAVAKYNSLCSLGSDCESCGWLEMCGGGCAYERFIANGKFSSVHPECSLKKRIFEYVKERVVPFI